MARVGTADHNDFGFGFWIKDQDLILSALRFQSKIENRKSKIVAIGNSSTTAYFFAAA